MKKISHVDVRRISQWFRRLFREFFFIFFGEAEQPKVSMSKEERELENFDPIDHYVRYGLSGNFALTSY